MTGNEGQGDKVGWVPSLSQPEPSISLVYSLFASVPFYGADDLRIWGDSERTKMGKLGPGVVASMPLYRAWVRNRSDNLIARISPTPRKPSNSLFHLINYLHDLSVSIQADKTSERKTDPSNKLSQ